jgi:hypothetical protein
MSEYYLYPLGRLIQSALPGGLNIRSYRAARLTAKGEDALGCVRPLGGKPDLGVIIPAKTAPLDRLYDFEKGMTEQRTTKKRRPLVKVL